MDHEAEAEFFARTGDAADALLDAKDIAKRAGCGDDVIEKLSALVELIHDLQNTTIPGFEC
jgi:hypothetical protein